jgi:hypothetical protein
MAQDSAPGAEAHQYPVINSRAQSGARTAPRGRNLDITGLMSSTGVPLMASRPRTRSFRPSTEISVQTVTPMRFGRPLPRCAKCRPAASP